MNLLWAFDFGLAKDAAGQPIPIDLNDTTDVSSCLDSVWGVVDVPYVRAYS